MSQIANLQSKQTGDHSLSRTGRTLRLDSLDAVNPLGGYCQPSWSQAYSLDAASAAGVGAVMRDNLHEHILLAARSRWIDLQ